MPDVPIEEVMDSIREVSGVDDVAPDTNLGSLELDSLQIIEWISILEEKLDMTLDLGDLDFNDFRDQSISEAVRSLQDLAMPA
jgi:acyl carrier protein